MQNGDIMPRAPSKTTPKRNATEERLRATPFDGVDELSAEEKAIRLDVWRRFTESKVVEELLTKPEFKHVVDELHAGLSCSLHGNTKNGIYKIFSEGKGMKLEVNERFAESLGEHQIPFFQGVVQAGIEGWGTIYMQVKGLVSRPAGDAREFESAQKSKKISR
ncbi:MAG: hypothetical protein ABTQ25_12460 [Nitrosomonas ureae]